MFSKKLLSVSTFAVALLLSSILAASPAMAAKRGGGGQHNSGGTPTMTVSPNQVPLGATSITISGAGFAAKQLLSINTWLIPQPSVTTDANGSFSLVYSPSGTFWLAGPSSVQAVNPRTLAVLATANYTVCSSDPCQ